MSDSPTTILEQLTDNSHKDFLGKVSKRRYIKRSLDNVPCQQQPDALDVPTINVERTAYRLLERCRTDPEFLRKYILHVDLDKHQAAVFDSVWKNKHGELGGAGFNRVAWVAANGVGKTYTAAAIALGAAFTFRPIKVIITSKTGRQAKGQTWDEVKRIYNRSPFFQELKKNGTPFGELQETQLKISDGHFIVHFSVTGGKGAADIEAAFEGWHADNVLLIIDEAKQIPRAVWLGGERFFTNVREGWHRILAVGSAGYIKNAFGQCFYGRGASQWVHHKTTAFESLRVSNERAEEVVSKWGKHHSFTRSMVFAEFTSQSDNAVFKLDYIDFCTRYRDRTDVALPQPPDSGDVQVGIDWARSGSGETVFAVRKGGYLFTLKAWRKKSGVWSVGEVKHLLEEFPEAQIISDETGLGGGIQDFLSEQLGIESSRVARVQGLLVGNPPLRDREHFKNIRAEMFFELARRMERAYKERDLSICSLPDDAELRAQLASITMEYTDRGQIRLTSKDKMKRDGIASPDRADAVAMAFYRYPKYDPMPFEVPL